MPDATLSEMPPDLTIWDDLLSTTFREAEPSRTDVRDAVAAQPGLIDLFLEDLGDEDAEIRREALRDLVKSSPHSCTLGVADALANFIERENDPQTLSRATAAAVGIGLMAAARESAEFRRDERFARLVNALARRVGQNSGAEITLAALEENLANFPDVVQKLTDALSPTTGPESRRAPSIPRFNTNAAVAAANYNSYWPIAGFALAAALHTPFALSWYERLLGQEYSRRKSAYYVFASLGQRLPEFPTALNILSEAVAARQSDALDALREYPAGAEALRSEKRLPLSFSRALDWFQRTGGDIGDALNRWTDSLSLKLYPMPAGAFRTSEAEVETRGLPVSPREGGPAGISLTVEVRRRAGETAEAILRSSNYPGETSGLLYCKIEFRDELNEPEYDWFYAVLAPTAEPNSPFEAALEVRGDIPATAFSWMPVRPEQAELDGALLEFSIRRGVGRSQSRREAWAAWLRKNLPRSTELLRLVETREMP